MLKIYSMPNGHLYQFEESEAPSEAVPYEKKAEKPEKAKKPASKTRKADNK